MPGRSIVSNARAHLGRKIVINIDLKDFFPTITYRRVRGMFRHLGYSEPLATVMALLCTEPEIEQVELDGEMYYVAQSERRLPQGSPASPAITNIICRRLDKRLMGQAESFGFTYTRYADDITLSGDEPRQVCNVLRGVNDIVAHEGFTVHPDKTRVMRAGRRQEVTGVVVNDELGVNRKELRRFRALMHQVKRDGPEGKRWGASDNLFASMRGFASFVAMVTPAKGRALLEQVDALAAEHGGYGTTPARPPKTAPSWQRYQPPELASDPEEATADAVAGAEDDEDEGGESATPGTKKKRRKKRKRGRGTGRDGGADRDRDTRRRRDGRALAGADDEDDDRIEAAPEESSGNRIWQILLIVLVLLILRQLWRLLM